jgi:hypothetical protein
MAPYFTTLAHNNDYASLAGPIAGKYLVDAFCFDVYSLPELATDLDINFVPTLMWFMDGVQDALVWHQGVSVEGESVEKGVSRVVKRLKGSHEVGLEEDSDDDW